MDRLQRPDAHLRVYLRALHAPVTQHRLYPSQVCPVLQHLRYRDGAGGEGVTGLSDSDGAGAAAGTARRAGSGDYAEAGLQEAL